MESIQVADMYRAAVLEALEPFLENVDGNPLSQVVCVTSDRLPLAPEVHEALRKAFPALGYADEELFMLCCEGLDEDAVMTCVEAVDPVACVAIDRRSASVLASSYGIVSLEPGVAVMASGRRLVAVDDFGPALIDPARKRVAWEELKAARRPKPPI